MRRPVPSRRPDAAPPVRRRARARAALVVVPALAVLLIGCSGEEPAAYDAEFRAEFTEHCEAALDTGADDAVCRCWLERVEERVPFDELPPVEDLVDSSIPEAEPDAEPDALLNPGVDPLSMLAECVRSARAMATIPPTTAPPPTTPRPAPATTATTLP